MTPVSAESAPTAAAHAAASNRLANRRAIETLQPDLQVSDRLDVEWIFARDGALSALEGGRWLAGCSLPARAADAMLKKLDASGTVACFLAPAHAQQLRAVLRRLRPEQAVVVLLPDRSTLDLMLACENFSADIDAHRLWFACGDNWPTQLDQLLSEHIGLPVPSCFIRLPTLDEQQAGPLIATAQQIFSEQTAKRSSRLRLPTSRRGRVCVVAPSRFRLWDDAGSVLAQALCDSSTFAPLDVDDPLCASNVALAEAATDAGAVLAADLFRADLPGVVHESLPWVTWITRGRIVPVESAGPIDTLLLADPAWRPAAERAGWPVKRLGVAGWPAQATPPADPASPVALMADTQPLDVPPHLEEYSSHRLLWELIRQELRTDPFALGDDAAAFLDARMARLKIARDAIDRTLFVNRLMIPAYQQGLARAMIASRSSLRLYGRGWKDLPELNEHAAGPVETREQFDAAVAASSALVYAWPGRHLHRIDSLARPVIRLRRNGATRDSNLPTNLPPVSVSIILDQLQTARCGLAA